MIGLAEFGQSLRNFIYTDPVFELLRVGDWGAGGCWTLAKAVAEYLGPRAELWAIGSKENTVEHVLVRYDDVYLDDLGARTRSQVLSDFRSEHPRRRSVRLVPLTPWREERARVSEVPCDPWVVQHLVKQFRIRFGEP